MLGQAIFLFATERGRRAHPLSMPHRKDEQQPNFLQIEAIVPFAARPKVLERRLRHSHVDHVEFAKPFW
jgi:hypothetical protein